MTHTWKIEEDQAGARLDVFLAEMLGTETTRSALKRVILDGQVMVNDQPASVHRFLKLGDVVVYEPKAIVRKQKTAQQTANFGIPASFRVIDESADWVVIDKPAGVLVHPDGLQMTNTLVDALIERFPGMKKVGEDPSRPGIVHRLDREVSGLMVVAKTQEAFEALKAQFAQHTIEKKYLALVHGEIMKEEGDIKFRIARSTSKARMAARPQEEEEGKAAWTHFHVLRRFIGATLVELEIMSGRTHQIRAHMHALGHPVIGDELYALKKTDRRVKSPRLMLQSMTLAFLDPKDGTKKSYELEADPAFAVLQEEFARS